MNGMCLFKLLCLESHSPVFTTNIQAIFWRYDIYYGCSRNIFYVKDMEGIFI